MRRVLQTDQAEQLLTRLGTSNQEFSREYPGESPRRQPVHTVYGGAQIFKAETAQKLGATALSSLREYGPTAAIFCKALGIGVSASFRNMVYDRIVEKLEREPVEDFRIDFEDGYGNRTGEEEDRHAVFTAEEVARGLKEHTLPPFMGIRIKPFTEDSKRRSVRTLELFLTTLLERTGGVVPENFVVTIPKVVAPEQVRVLAGLLQILESSLSLSSGSLKLELMIETPQSIVNNRGECMLPLLCSAAEGRCVAVHFGVYDYTASLNITAAYQGMMHPSCDFARQVMKTSLAGTGIWISDGATNIMPVGPHRVTSEGKSLTPRQKNENRETVHRVWRLNVEHVRHSLENGYYQGWDLHPAQLPVRYAAVYAFFLEGLDAASTRLKTFIERAAQATLIGQVFDDAATGQGLLNYFLRGINCGAITEQEALRTGLTLDEIRLRSFAKIMARKQQGM
ncbi:MAG TPA: phosphoenolpyruvate kinase [Bacteroidota bacterium]|nr:phosphoenolpyruvate kinase [Bacteroidota bacterium]